MKFELDEKYTRISKKYPDLFDKNFYGLEIPDGWFPAIEQAVEDIYEFSKRMKKEVTILQIKEKFGKLRFYFDCDKDFMDQMMYMVAHTEGIINCTCAKCGKMQLRLKVIPGYITYICDECYNNHPKEDFDEEA